MDRDIALSIVATLGEIKTTVEALATNTTPTASDSRSVAMPDTRFNELEDNSNSEEQEPDPVSEPDPEPEPETKTTTRKK